MRNDYQIANELEKRVIFLHWCVLYGEKTAKEMVQAAKRTWA